MSTPLETAKNRLVQDNTRETKIVQEGQKERSRELPSQDYYIPNMLNEINRNIAAINKFREEISQMLKEIDQKQQRNLLEIKKMQEEKLSKFNDTLAELKQTLAKNAKDPTSRKQLGTLVKEIFELHRHFYILYLDSRLPNVDRYFKIDNQVKRSGEVLETLRDVFHTIRMAIPQFEQYFKYKTKGKENGIDYRVPIKWGSFQEDSANNAKKTLIQHPGFQNKIGREKILIAEFPKLSLSEFNLLLDQTDPHTNRDILHRTVFGKNNIIFFLKDFQSNTMDLHGFDLKVALSNAHISVREVFMNFKNSVTLLSGQGKHSASGKSIIQFTLLKQLKLWKSTHQFAIKKCIRNPKNPGQIIVAFHPPKIILYSQFTTEIEKLIQNQEQRIIVKLDKKYPSNVLWKVAVRFIYQAVMAHSGIEISLGEPSKVEADFIRFTIHYPNENVNTSNIKKEAEKASSQAITISNTETDSKVAKEQKERQHTSQSLLHAFSTMKTDQTKGKNVVLHKKVCDKC